MVTVKLTQDDRPRYLSGPIFGVLVLSYGEGATLATDDGAAVPFMRAGLYPCPDPTRPFRAVELAGTVEAQIAQTAYEATQFVGQVNTVRAVVDVPEGEVLPVRAAEVLPVTLTDVPLPVRSLGQFQLSEFEIEGGPVDGAPLFTADLATQGFRRLDLVAYDKAVPEANAPARLRLVASYYGSAVKSYILELPAPALPHDGTPERFGPPVVWSIGHGVVDADPLRSVPPRAVSVYRDSATPVVPAVIAGHLFLT